MWKRLRPHQTRRAGGNAMMTPEELQDARELWNIPGTLGWKAINHIDEQEKEIVALKQEVKSLE